MNEGKKKRIFVLLWILIIMMTYYSTTNINFSEQNVTKNKMEILEKAQSPKEIYRAKTISERSIYGENAIDNLFSEKGEKSVYDTRNIYKDSKGNVLEYDTTSLIYSTTVYQKISNSISRERFIFCAKRSCSGRNKYYIGRYENTNGESSVFLLCSISKCYRTERYSQFFQGRERWVLFFLNKANNR